jgi:hypothetical protein
VNIPVDASASGGHLARTCGGQFVQRQMAMGRDSGCWNHPAAWDADDTRGVGFDVPDQLQPILDQLAGTDPFQVLGPKFTLVGMLTVTMGTESTDARLAFERP